MNLVCSVQLLIDVLVTVIDLFMGHLLIYVLTTVIGTVIECLYTRVEGLKVPHRIPRCCHMTMSDLYR